MTEDLLFRNVTMGVVALFIPVAVWYRRKSDTGEKLDRRQEGNLMRFGLRLSAAPLFIGGAVWAINPAWMDWANLPLPNWVRSLGIAILFGWGMLLVWSFKILGPNLTDTVVTRKEHQLVTSGPYRFVRHPFYVAFALGIIGGVLSTASWFFLLFGGVTFGFLYARTATEEANLVERFGSEYTAYMAHVGRFWPKRANR